MGANTEELLKPRFFCSSYTGSFEALHTVQLSADTVLKNCSYSHFAPLPRMQQDCGAYPAHAVSRGYGERYQLGIALQLCCKATVWSPLLFKGQPRRWDCNTNFATQVHLCWISAQSKVSVQLQIVRGGNSNRPYIAATQVSLLYSQINQVLARTQVITEPRQPFQFHPFLLFLVDAYPHIFLP